jgi:hypothetical protein
VLLSLEIVSTWIMAVSIFALCRYSNLLALAGVGRQTLPRSPGVRICRSPPPSLPRPVPSLPSSSISRTDDRAAALDSQRPCRWLSLPVRARGPQAHAGFGGWGAAGEPFELDRSYLKVLGGVLVMVGAELHLKSKRKLKDAEKTQPLNPPFEQKLGA